MSLVRLKRWSLAFALLAAISCSAETLTATAPIVGGDIAAARADALRDILWEAGVRGNALVFAKAAALGDDYAQSTIVRSSFRLKKFEIVDEEPLGDRLRITAEVERDEATGNRCEAALPLRNIDFVWRGMSGRRIAEANRQGGIIFGATLKDQLGEDLGAYLLPPKLPGREAVYRISGFFESADSSLGLTASVKAIRFQIRAADNGKLVREFSLPAEFGSLASQEKTNLGYAMLRHWELTSAARALLDSVRTRLGDEIRCLPAVARIPATGPDGGFTINTDSASEIGERGLVLFASSWPVTENGGVDLLRVDGFVQPKRIGEKVLQFSGQKQLAGRKYPMPGGYLLFQ